MLGESLAVLTVYVTPIVPPFGSPSVIVQLKSALWNHQTLQRRLAVHVIAAGPNHSCGQAHNSIAQWQYNTMISARGLELSCHFEIHDPDFGPLRRLQRGRKRWSKEFEAKSSDDLKHDRPYTVRMVNAGPRANFLL